MQKRRHLDTFQQVDSYSPLELQNIHSGSTLPGNFCWLTLKRVTAEWVTVFCLFVFCPFSRCNIFVFTALARQDKEALKERSLVAVV